MEPRHFQLTWTDWPLEFRCLTYYSVVGGSQFIWEVWWYDIHFIHLWSFRSVQNSLLWTFFHFKKVHAEWKLQRSSEKQCGDPNGFMGDMSAPGNIGPHREAAWSSGPFMASWISTHIFLPLINPRSCLHAWQNGFRKQLGLIALKRSSMWPWNMSIFLSTTSCWTRRELIGAMVPEIWPIAIWCHM